MKSLQEMLNESLEVNEGMKCVKTTDEASYIATKKETITMEYHGDDKADCEDVYNKFKSKFGVEGVYAEEGNILIIPTNKKMQKMYTDQEWNPDKGEETEFGISLKKLQW